MDRSQHQTETSGLPRADGTTNGATFRLENDTNVAVGTKTPDGLIPDIGSTRGDFMASDSFEFVPVDPTPVQDLGGTDNFMADLFNEPHDVGEPLTRQSTDVQVGITSWASSSDEALHDL